MSDYQSSLKQISIFSIIFSRMTLGKDDFYMLAKEMRAIASKNMDFGSCGIGGGVDGEVCSSTFYDVVKSLDTEFIKIDEDAWGIDIGSGSGVASMAYFNGGMGLNMIGIECNEQRFRYCLSLQSILLGTSYGEKFSQIAKKSQFFEGTGFKRLIEILGVTNPIVHLKLLYWFREGWNPDDIRAILDYVNRLVINLKWIICDMDKEKLLNFGFKGHIISSVQFSGSMIKSSNSRTLHVHHVQMHSSASTTRTVHAVGEREQILLANFRKSAEEVHSQVTVALELLLIRSDNSKKDRAASLKRKGSIELAPNQATSAIKIEVPRRSRLLKKLTEKGYSQVTVALEPVQIRSNNSKKDQAASLKRKTSIELSPEPSTPEIKIEETRHSPCNKKKSKRRLIRKQQEEKRDARLLRMERNLNEILDYVQKFKNFKL